MVGREPAVWLLDDWANSPPIRWADLRGNVVFVRFWTIGSEYCRRTMPAVQRLAEEFGGQPVIFIGIYCAAEDPDGLTWPVALEQSRRWSVTFPIARDEHGVTLRRWWHDYFNHLPDTPSFVIDPDGKIAYVHPGPEFHPSDDPMYALCDRDYNAIRAAIQRSLPQDVSTHR